MSNNYEKMSLFEQLESGLRDSIAFSRGELNLKTTELPAPPPPVHPAQVRAIREGLKMSQAMFAATVNVSTKTVQSWEQGARRPSDAALRMLQVIRDQPQVVERILRRPSWAAAKAASRKSAAQGRAARAAAKKGRPRHRRLASGAKPNA